MATRPYRTGVVTEISEATEEDAPEEFRIYVKRDDTGDIEHFEADRASARRFRIGDEVVIALFQQSKRKAQ